MGISIDRIRHGQIDAIIWGSLGVLIFSLSLPATRLAVADLDSTVVGLGRSVVAGVLATILLAVKREPLPPRRYWQGLGIVACGVVLGFPLFSAWALTVIPASHGAVIVGLTPMATAVIATLRAGERPRVSFWISSLLGLAAVIAFAVIQGAGRPTLADGLILIAVMLAAVGYAEGGKLARNLGGWRVISWALVFSLPILLPAGLIRAAQTGLSAGAPAWVGFAYVSIFSMFLGFFAWYHALSLGGIARIGQLQLAQPILTVLWSVWLLHEKLTLTLVLAALAVLACVIFTQRSRIERRIRAPSEEQSPVN
jgi:drug/metabolite transporter (DMT)-like permease